MASREARRATRSHLQDWHVPAPVVDDALIVVSELVTNAVRHAGDESDTLELELARSGDHLRVALSDGSTASPSPRSASHVAEDGRGMAILAALSDRWGIEPHNGGKQVWWEVDLSAREGRSDTPPRADRSLSA
jgi:anti-sigma regulatory factor (Ser/Thr protein kinase)